MAKKMGRPESPEYRKKAMRFSKVEDKFKKILKDLETDNDRKLILNILDELKA